MRRLSIIFKWQGYKMRGKGLCLNRTLRCCAPALIDFDSVFQVHFSHQVEANFLK